MAEAVATAFVEIRPDLKGFEALLRTGVSSAIKKIAAPVKVTPNLTGFQAGVRAAARAAAGSATVPVKVVPDLTGFQAAIRGAARAASTTTPIPVRVVPNLAGFEAAIGAVSAKPIPVKVIPNLAGFKTALQTQVRAAGTATPIGVPVAPDVKGFHAALRSSIAAETVAPIQVLVIPNLAGFHAAVTGEVAADEKLRIGIPIVPNLAGFQTAVTEAREAAEKPVVIPIVPSLAQFRTALGEAALAETKRPVKIPVLPNLLTFNRELRVGAKPVPVPVVPVLTKFHASIRQAAALEESDPIAVPVVPNLAEFHAVLASKAATQGIDPVVVPVLPNLKVFQTILQKGIGLASKSLEPVLVPVLPNLTGFAAKLREGVAAKAAKPVPVPVTPNLRGFQATLRAEIKAKTPRPVPVQFTPSLVGFQAKLQAALRTVRTRTIPVRLVPSLVGFQASARTAIRELSFRPVKVPFIPNTVGFHSTARAEIAAEQAKPVLIPVLPNLKGFQTALRVAARETNLKPIPVTVVPSLTGFQAALRAEYAKKTIAPLPVPIRPVLVSTFVSDVRAQVAKRTIKPIAVPVTTGGVAAGAAAGTQQLTRATKGVTSATTGATVATKTLVKSQRQLKQSTNEAFEVMGKFQHNTERFSRGVAATGLSLFGLRGATLAATTAFLAGAASITAIAKAVGAATGFQQQLSVFAVTAGATAEQMLRVREASIELGKDPNLPSVSARDAAEAMTELAKAGLSVQDSIAGARGVLQLGTAANISFADATTLAANAINAFSLEGGDASHVADVLANAANAAQGSIVDMGVAFGQAAAVAHQVGLTFEDTAVFTTALAKAGLTSSDAGTSLRTALIRLINPTKKAQEIFQRLGLELRDAQGNIRPEFFTNLGTAIAAMTKKQRDATLAQIGGQDAIRALSIFSKQSIGDLLALREEMRKQGTAADVAAARNVGLAGAGRNLSNTIETLSISLGSKATPSLTSFTNALTGAVSATAQSPLVTGALADAASATGDAFRNLGGIIASFTRLLSPLASVLNTVLTSIGGGTILTAVIGFKALRSAIKGLGAGDAFKSLEASKLKGSTNAFTTLGAAALIAGDKIKFAARDAVAMATSTTLLRVGLLEIGSAFAAFATSGAGIALIVAGLTAGIFFLATRDSQLERAQKSLKASTDDLANSFVNLHNAQQANLSAKQTVRRDEETLAETKHQAALAKSALANLRVGATTSQRQQAENRVAITLQDIDFAEQQLAIDRQAAADAAKVEANAVLENTKKQSAAIRDLLDVQDEELTRQKALATFHFGTTQTEAQNRAVKELNATLNENAQILRARGHAEDIDQAQRLEALVRVNRAFGGLKERTVRILLNADSVESGLRSVEKDFIRTGDKAQAGFVREILDGIRAGLSPEQLLIPFRRFVVDFINIAAKAGHDGGTAMATNFGDILQNLLETILARTQGIINAAITRSVRIASNQTDTLLQRITRIQLAGGSLQQQLAAAKAAEVSAARELRRADKLPGRTPKEREIKKQKVDKAISDLGSAQSTERSLQAEIAAEAKTAADKTKKAADDAQAAADEADRALIDLFSGRRSVLDLRQLRAQATERLNDDIAAQKAISAELRADIISAAGIKDAQLRKETIQGFEQALEQSNQALAQLQVTQIKNKFALATTKAEATETLADDLSVSVALGNAIRKAISSAKQTITDVRERIVVTNALSAALKIQQAATEALRKQFVVQQRDREQEKLDLDVQIAEAQGNKGKELAAHKRLLNFLIQRRKHTDAGTLEYKKLTLQIEQQRAAIREAHKAQADAVSEAQKLQFEFLTTQSGFVNTLLSNLIPRGAVAGTVGGVLDGAVSTSTKKALTQPLGSSGIIQRKGQGDFPAGSGNIQRIGMGDFPSSSTGAGGPQRPPDVGAGLAKDAAGGGPRGSTFGQMHQLIVVQQHMLQVLMRLAGQRAHPEATYQKYTGANDMNVATST